MRSLGRYGLFGASNVDENDTVPFPRALKVVFKNTSVSMKDGRSIVASTAVLPENRFCRILGSSIHVAKHLPYELNAVVASLQTSLSASPPAPLCMSTTKSA